MAGLEATLIYVSRALFQADTFNVLIRNHTVANEFHELDSMQRNTIEAIPGPEDGSEPCRKV